MEHEAETEAETEAEAKTEALSLSLSLPPSLGSHRLLPPPRAHTRHGSRSPRSSPARRSEPGPDARTGRQVQPPACPRTNVSAVARSPRQPSSRRRASQRNHGHRPRRLFSAEVAVWLAEQIAAWRQQQQQRCSSTSKNVQQQLVSTRAALIGCGRGVAIKRAAARRRASGGIRAGTVQLLLWRRSYKPATACRATACSSCRLGSGNTKFIIVARTSTTTTRFSTLK